MFSCESQDAKTVLRKQGAEERPPLLSGTMFSLANEEGTDVLGCVGKREAAVAWRVQAAREVSL